MYVRRKDIVLGTFGGVIKERIVSPRRVVASMKNVHIHSDPIRKFIMIIIHYSVVCTFGWIALFSFGNVQGWAISIQTNYNNRTTKRI